MSTLSAAGAVCLNPPAKPAPQRFLNGEIHDWYRIVLGYSDHLVSGIVDRFKLGPQDVVLDPFCGTGTTLIECMKKGIPSVGIDANPSSVFGATVKTDWHLDPEKLRREAAKVADAYETVMRKRKPFTDDLTRQYLDSSGMLERGWISPKPLRKALALKIAVSELAMEACYRNALKLALINEVVRSAANVKFGPELYCGPAKKDVDVRSCFLRRVDAMCADLTVARSAPHAEARVLAGDARRCDEVIESAGVTRISAIICSPPYPTEHDYTRNSRLELAFLEMVTNRSALREVKKEMVRSHTKGIYKTDEDAAELENHPTIAQITADIDVRAKEKTHGFARLYSTVVREYFGGMQKHFRRVYPILRPGGLCAYVVGDQSSYLQIHIDTAEILADLAGRAGFEVLGIDHWRSRWSTTTSREIGENILILRKPQLQVVPHA
jgi:hypothetical protein